MELSLAAEVREGLGKQKVIKLRANGQVPGVLYGEKKATEHIQVNTQELERLLVKNGTGKLVKLDLKKGKADETEYVLFKEVKYHPVNGNVLHIDLLRVAMDHAVTVKVPVHLINEEKRTKDNAVIELLIHELEVSCLPSAIPESVKVDVSKLVSGAGIHVKDIKVGEGVKILDAEDEMVVIAAAHTVEAEPETVETAEPEAAGEKKEA